MKEYEIHPCEIVGKDSKGLEIMEQCAEDSENIACWSLYEHITGKGLEWVADFESKEEAEKHKAHLTKPAPDAGKSAEFPNSVAIYYVVEVESAGNPPCG